MTRKNFVQTTLRQLGLGALSAAEKEFLDSEPEKVSLNDSVMSEIKVCIGCYIDTKISLLT